MKFRTLLSFLLIAALLAGCAAGLVQAGQLEGCWFMGSDREYFYLTRFASDGSFEILWVPRGGRTEIFTIEGSYTLEDGVLNRVYQREMPENSALTLPAELKLRDGALILSYGELRECWAKLTPEAESLCLTGAGSVQCPECQGLGIRGIRDDLPLWCEECCGLGIVAQE